jgi:hypothetical protein
MADPIVCDCGGSTRIRQILPTGVGDLPDLLDVHDFPGSEHDPDKKVILAQLQAQFPGERIMGSQQKVPPGATPFTKLTIMFQDATGTPFTIRVGGLPKSLVIASSLGQNVRVDFFRDFTELIITIFSTVADPLVEAKQLRNGAAFRKRPHHKAAGAIGQRRYIVVNAGPIETIFLDSKLIFDATDLTPDDSNRQPVGPVDGPLTPAPGLPLYVSVVVT